MEFVKLQLKVLLSSIKLNWGRHDYTVIYDNCESVDSNE